MTREAADPAVGRDGGGPARTRRRLALVWCSGLAVIHALRAFLPPLLRDDVQNGDLHQHVWWTWIHRDPSLFPDDPALAFFSGTTFAPPGHHAIYRLLVPWMSPERVSELGAFVIGLLTAALFFVVGRSAAGGRLAGGVVALTAFCVSHGMRDHVEAVLPRAFALALLLLFLRELGARRPFGVGVAFLLAALFYPPVIVVMGAAAAFLVSWRAAARPREILGWWPALPGLAAAALLVFASYGDPDADHGPKLDLETARTMAELGPEGRSRFFEDSAADFWFRSQRAGFGDPPVTVALVLVAFAVVLARRRSWLPPELVAFAAASLAAFLLAHAVLFALHLPNRHVRAPFKIVEILLVAILAARLIEVLADRLRRRLPAAFPRTALATAAAILALAGFGVSAAAKIDRELRAPRDDDRMAALAHVARLPADTLVAAHPDDADAVPLVTRRSILASSETALPWQLGYYRVMKPRLEAALAGLLATDWDELDALHREHGVDVFLVDERRLQDGRWTHSAPFATAQAARHARGASRGFVLSEPGPARTLFRSGPWSVVRVGPPPEVRDAGDPNGR